MTDNKKQVTSNFLWRLMERIGAQSVSLVVSIVLARILDPEVYGTVALVTVFTVILEVFISSGIASALIQKQNADHLDFSTIFFFNIACSIILYGIMFIGAPFIAGFYNRPELTTIVRVLSLTVLISGVKNVQHAYVARHMMFKKFFFATLGGTIGAGFLGIVMAINGFGVWALVSQSLFNNTVDTIILWMTVEWRPKREFSFERLKQLYSYGWKILVSSLIAKVYEEFRSLIIGKKYTGSDLAFYNRGMQFPNLIVYNINTSIDSVLLPTMARVQDNTDKVRNMTRRAIKTSTYLMMPLMIGLAVCAEPIVRILLTEKWLPCVFYMRIFCVCLAFYPVHTANLNAIKAMGRSDLFLILEIIKKVIGTIAIVSTMFISVEAMAYSLLVTAILSQIINSWPNRKLLGYSFENQIMDILPQILLSVLMGAVVYCVQFIGLRSWVTLLIQVPVGVVIYIALSKIFHIDSFEYFLSIIKSLFSKKKKKEVSE